MPHLTHLDDKGRAVLPAKLRAAVGLKPGDGIVVRVAGAGLTVEPVSVVKARVRARVPTRARDGGAVDRLLADRRADEAGAPG